MTVSRRAQSVAPSATLKISARAKALKREGREVISLSTGEPDFRTPDYICEAAIQAIKDGHHGYTVNTGTPELREAISQKLKRDNGLEYSPDHIVASNGAKQSLGFTLLALLDPDDETVIPAPYWVSYPEMVKLADGIPVPVRTDISNNYKITPQQLDDAISVRTKVVMLCSPSNPTGACYSSEELEALADVLRSYPDVYIISDEIYEYIVFEGEHTGILNVAPDLKDRTIVINGFSKGFAMTGWRLGYLAGPPEVAQAVAKIQSQETSAPCAISQKAGEAAYSNPLDQIFAMRDAFKQRRDFIVEALRSIEGVEVFKPGGAFYVFPDVSAYYGRETPGGDTINTSTELCLYLLESCGIATVPGDAFGEPNGIRLSYAASMEELKTAISKLEEGLLNLS
ncbi:MAG: pyridoxal phosphate-dependent aminotransferase [Bacteroidota bacterium]